MRTPQNPTVRDREGLRTDLQRARSVAAARERESRQEVGVAIPDTWTQAQINVYYRALQQAGDRGEAVRATEGAHPTELGFGKVKAWLTMTCGLQSGSVLLAP